MTMLSTLVTGWLIGATAASAAPLPGYYDLFPEPKATAQSTAAAQAAARRERERALEQAQRDRERALEQAQEERDRAQAQAQTERERAQEQAQRERERAQARAQAERERAQRDRERAQEQAQRDRERAQEQAQRERERAQEQAQRERDRAQQHAERERGRRRGESTQVEGEKIARSFTVGRQGSLMLQNVSGDIVVTAGGGSEIRVEATKRAKSRAEGDARAQLENVVVTMREAGGGRIEVRTEHRGRENRGWVDFNVVMPADASAELHSVSGNITITGVKGELRAETVSGDVRASGLARLALLKSVSGDIEINTAEAEGTLTLSSVSGDVNATNIKARALDASSVSGDTILRGCACDRVQANSVSGSLEYSGRISKTGRYEMKTHSGDIALYHLGSAFDLAASTFSGGITVDPALSLKTITNRYGPGRSARGSVGGGGAYVELTTFSGNIVVAKGASQ